MVALPRSRPFPVRNFFQVSLTADSDNNCSGCNVSKNEPGELTSNPPYYGTGNHFLGEPSTHALCLTQSVGKGSIGLIYVP